MCKFYGFENGFFCPNCFFRETVFCQHKKINLTNFLQCVYTEFQVSALYSNLTGRNLHRIVFSCSVNERIYVTCIQGIHFIIRIKRKFAHVQFPCWTLELRTAELSDHYRQMEGTLREVVHVWTAHSSIILFARTKFKVICCSIK